MRILAIDQGGTKTDILLADERGHLLGYGNDRDWVPVPGERRAVRMLRVRHAAENAARDAGIPLAAAERVSASCNGADWPFEYPIGENNLRRTLGIQQVTLYNDCIGALRGGTPVSGRDCAVLCLGTGANCAVFSRDGRRHIYHYYMKDIHQGAGAIGRFLFQAVFDAQAGLGPKTALTALLLEKTGYGDVDELLTAITTGRTETEKPWTPVYKEYCPLLFQAVAAGDAVASDYLRWLCGELAEYVAIAARRLQIQGRPFPVVLSGGVPKGGAVMARLLEESLRKRLPGVWCVQARLEPVVGALLLEYDRLYPEGVPEEIMNTLKEGCRQRQLIRKIEGEEGAENHG